jgi:hypothetical protein
VLWRYWDALVSVMNHSAAHLRPAAALRPSDCLMSTSDPAQWLCSLTHRNAQGIVVVRATVRHYVRCPLRSAQWARINDDLTVPLSHEFPEPLLTPKTSLTAEVMTGRGSPLAPTPRTRAHLQD